MVRRALLILCAAGVLTAQTAPSIHAINPSSAPAGSPSLFINVTGTNFSTSTTIHWNGLALTTGFVSASQLVATVPAELLANAGAVALYAQNPGSARSNGVGFTVIAPLAIASTALPRATVGVNYSVQLNATGGAPPYRWTPNTPLPTGFALSTTGTLSGTPTSAQPLNFDIRVTDSANAFANTAFTITPEIPLLVINTGQLPAGRVNQPYTTTLAATGGIAPYTWSVAGPEPLPQGLQLNAATGAITGTPTVAGTHDFTIQLRDNVQGNTARRFAITVVPPPLEITTAQPLFAGIAGESYSQTFTATGGAPPYRWTVASGDTGGLVLDASSGTLQGTPRAPGNLGFTVQVTDRLGGSATAAYTIAINAPALTISTGQLLPAGAVGSVYSQSFAAAGGKPPYVWIHSSGALVPGLTFDPAAATISGVPSTPGSFTFTLQVRDASGLVVSRAFTVQITATPLLFAGSERVLPGVRINEPFSHRLLATGGVAPYTFTANGLPAGLNINAATGLISGTPTAAGSFGFTVRVTDAAATTVVDLFRLNVELPPAPGARILGLPETAGAADQLSLDVELERSFPAPIAGQALLTFSPDSGGGDSTIQFATGGRTASFSVPTGATAVPPGRLAIQTGTVAGTITVTLRLTAGGVDITPNPAPTARIRIERAAPVIQALRFTRAANAVTVQVTGYATGREITQAGFTFTAAPGQTLQASTFTTSVEDVFARWFQDPASGQFGSQFVFSQTFNIQGDPNAISLASVTLTNRTGSVTSSEVIR